MPSLPAFISSAYEARSLNLAADRLVNLYPEMAETTRGKNVAAFYGTPGLRRTHTLPGSGGIRALYTSSTTGRVFAVRGDRFYEIFAGGTFQQRGTLTTTSGHAQMADNGTQLIIADGGRPHILTLATNAFAQVTDPDFPNARQVAFIDGYFVFPFPDSGRFGITGLFEGFTVDSLDFATAEGSPDNIIGIAADHREPWLLGTRSIEVWFNSGNVDFPFQRIQGAFIEYGCGAAFSIANLANTIYWLGNDERGQHIIWRATGYQPERISTHAIEFAISGYSASSRVNARAYTYQTEGHSYYVINFDEASWCYDVATSLWHERARLMLDGTLGRHRADCYTSGFGLNLVGDFADGRIYDLDMDYFFDDTKEIVRLRACPHFAGEDLQRVFHHWFQLDLEAGVGRDGGTEPGVTPKVFLRFSDDGGHTWSQPKESSAGALGQYKFRALWRRLGASRDRVYELRQSDPVKVAWINSKVQVSNGYS